MPTHILARAAAVVAAAFLAGTAHAAVPTVTLVQSATGLALPVEAVPARDGSGRLFIVQQGGRIRILRNGSLLATDFLTLNSSVIVSGGERGLLGLAFHPQYLANGTFFIYYTAAGTGALTVAEVRRSAANPDVADAASRRVILSIPHPVNDNHNGGKIAFGPDGYLYIATGDGGGGGDPDRNAQDRGTLLGKLLRIAPDLAGGYAIPPGNPFAAGSCAAGLCPEVYHYGLRNPWKFSFDRQTGDLYIGDVGQGSWEEIDFLPLGAPGGANFGWGVFEANACFNDNYFGAPGACAGLAGHTRPILWYDRDAGTTVSGGFVYRGTRSAPLRGYYIYGDFGSRRVWAARRDATGAWVSEVLLPPPAAVSAISSFAEDESGEIHIVDYGNGKLWRIDGPGPAAEPPLDFNRDGLVDIVLRNRISGGVFAWFMDGTRLLADAPLFSSPTAWTVAGVADFNGDGSPDLIVRETGTGRAFIWLYSGTTFLGDVELFGVDPVWEIVATGDVDASGTADIVMRNRATGLAFAYLMNGPAIAGSVFLFAIDPRWEIAGAADFNADGHLDLVYRDSLAGTAFVWYLANGIFQSEAFLLSVDPVWEIAQVGDFDGDGRPDVVLRHRGNGTAFVWHYDNATFLSESFLFSVSPDWEMKPLQ
ncbi:MAG: PQQ-dependent sugar dehydrogenase [Burkholderiales bacterium]